MMAEYQILYWKHIPSGVKATDSQQTIRVSLPERFQQAIDRAAMLQGLVDTDSYTAQFHWGPVQKREGTAQEVAHAVVQELDAQWKTIPLREP